MGKRFLPFLAVALAALIGVGGCGSGSTGPDPSGWLSPTATSPSSLPKFDMVISRDIADVAEYSTLIVRGHFAAKVADVDGLTLFGPVDPKTEEGKRLAYEQRQRRLVAWKLSVDKVMKGDVAFEGTTIYVLVELMETDVPGVLVDPSRVAKRDVVVMLHTRPVETLPYGPAYWINGTGQVGAGFQIVDANGRLSVDPLAKIPLRSERPDVPASASIEQQLGLSAVS